MYNTTQQRKSWGAGNFPFNWAALYCAHFEGEKLYDLQSYNWQTTDKPCQAWSRSCLCSYFLQVTCLVGVSLPMSDPAAGRAEQRSQGNVTLWSKPSRTGTCQVSNTFSSGDENLNSGL